MKFNLYTIDHCPKSLPIWETILDDLGRPEPKRIARVLGVGLSTVYRWNALKLAPRSACLALYWLTRWGRSDVHAAAVNDATAAVGYANALYAENRQLRTRLEHVLALSDTGAANGPLLGGSHGR